MKTENNNRFSLARAATKNNFPSKWTRSGIAALLLALLCAAVASVPAATITVNSIADGGAGSLRLALATATDGDTIDASGTSGIIQLGPQLLVTNSVTILGPGPNQLTVAGNGSFSRVFYIGPGITASISGLTITNGVGAGGGGGIWNDHAMLTVSNCTLSGNFASSGFGGGIKCSGGNHGSVSLQIVNSTLSGNSAEFGGGIGNDGGGGSATLTVSNCTFSDTRPAPAAAFSTMV